MGAPANWKISEVDIDDLLATDEVCYMTGINRQFIWEMVKQGKVPAVQRYMNEKKKYGRQYFFSPKSIPIIRKLADELEGKMGVLPVRNKEVADDDIVNEMLGKPVEMPRAASPRTIRYARITPGFIRALSGFLGLTSAADLVALLGYPETWYLNRWFQDYNPQVSKGWVLGLQATVFWYTKLLYRKGIIPYSLARMGGVFDYKAHVRETKILRRLERYGWGNSVSVARQKFRDAKGDEPVPAPAQGSEDPGGPERAGHGLQGGSDEAPSPDDGGLRV